MKKALKQGYKAGIYSEIANDVVRPSAEECARNGRARSYEDALGVRHKKEIGQESVCSRIMALL